MERNARINLAAMIGALVLISILSLMTGAMIGDRPARDPSERPSTFFTDPSGTRATLYVLQALLPEVVIWRKPLELLPEPGGSHASSLLVAQPQLSLTPLEVERLLTWMKAGGQVVLATRTGWAIGEEGERPEPEVESPASSPPSSPSPAVSEASPPPVLEAASPVVPETSPLPEASLPPLPSLDVEGAGGNTTKDLLTLLGVRLKTGTPADPGDTQAASIGTWQSPVTSLPLSLSIRPAPEWESVAGENAAAGTSVEGATPFRPLLVQGEKVAAIEVPVGVGRLVVIADPGFFSNQSLRRADNLVWLVHLIEGWGNRRVVIDEFHHGFGAKRPITALVKDFLGTPWGFVALQAGAAGLLYVFWYRRRMGAVVEESHPGVRSPLEQVRARGAFFHAANARGLAIELMVQQLTLELARRSGVLEDFPHVHRRLLERNPPPAVRESLDKLLDLFLRSQDGKALSDEDVLEAGRLTARIPQELLARET